MNILGIDTAGRDCSVMLLANGQKHKYSEQSERMHSRLILKLIQDLCAQANIEPENIQLLAWNAGPGSFTGLRIAASVVQSIAYSFSLPVVSLSSLEILAQAACRQCQFVDEGDPVTVNVAIHARTNAAYWASFTCYQSVLLRTEPDLLLSVVEIEERLIQQSGAIINVSDGVHLPGLESAQQVVVDSCIEDIVDLAVTKATQVWELTPQLCLPNYVQDEINWKKRKLGKPVDAGESVGMSVLS